MSRLTPKEVTLCVWKSWKRIVRYDSRLYMWGTKSDTAVVIYGQSLADCFV